MELFTVNRYTEEKSKAAKEATTNEEDILQKLLQKAEKRKRKRKTSESTDIKAETARTEPTTEQPAKDESTDAAAEQPLPDEAPAAEEAEPSNDFQVIGEDASKAKRQKVEMVLPPWLAHPTIIEGGSLEEGSDEVSIKELPYLEKYTCNALKQMKIKRLFPVQAAVIPWILEAQSKPEPFRPRDICVSAPTGSGKTLAFAIPIVQLLAKRVQCKVRALVVLPVAELALQVYKVFSALCSQTELEVCLLSKQHSLEDEQDKLLEQYKGEYYSKVDIVVTTPGRLVDHLHATKGFCLKSLKFLVIDEADRIMDAVFQNWLYHLDSHVRSTTDQLLTGIQAPLCYQELLNSSGKQPHKLLFSATLSQDPEKLQNLRLFQPKLFTTVLTMPVLKTDAEGGEVVEQASQFIGKYTTPAELTEQYCVTEMRLKPLTLFSMAVSNNWKRFLCFTNSAETANRLTFVLQNLFKATMKNMRVEALSADLSAQKRGKHLTDFARGNIQGLICSDALARGIDVPNVDIVVSYEVPRHIKTHIHRVGRTARAGQRGTAITLLTEKDQAQFKKMLYEVGKSMGEETVVSADIEATYANVYKAALEKLQGVQKEKKLAKKVAKLRIERSAKIHKIEDRPLTLMEKLQQKAVLQPAVPTPSSLVKRLTLKSKAIKKRPVSA